MHLETKLIYCKHGKYVYLFSNYARLPKRKPTDLIWKASLALLKWARLINTGKLNLLKWCKPFIKRKLEKPPEYKWTWKKKDKILSHVKVSTLWFSGGSSRQNTLAKWEEQAKWVLKG